MSNDQPIPTGSRWVHYRGGEYIVVCCAKHTETEDTLVIYANAAKQIFARPLSMWTEEVSPGVHRFIPLT